MQITSGLWDRMVLQRSLTSDGSSTRNQSNAPFGGTCQVAQRCTLRARVTRRGRVVAGFRDALIGQAHRGRFTGSLTGLPAGGPYDIELTLAPGGGKAPASARRAAAPLGKLRVRSVLVGDVWIAAGQSNMQGCGEAAHAARPQPMVRALYMDDRWDTARDPIHQLDIAVDSVHNGGNRSPAPAPNPKGVGPAVAFAQEMFRRTGVPQGILACAHGGTSMSQWDPKLRHLGGGSLYGATLRRLARNGGQVAGVIWYQGESDCNDAATPLYSERMRELVRAFRRDCRQPRLPFVAVQLGRFIGEGFPAAAWNSVQEQQRGLAKLLRRCAVVPAVDLQLDDTIHIGGRDQQRLGRRLAHEMDVLLRGRRAPGSGGGKGPIALRRIRIEPHPVSNQVDVLVQFDNVVGTLRVADGARPSGFAVCDPGPGAFIYDTRLEGDTVRMCTTLAMGGLGDKVLHHGYGTDPYCNITDAAGRPIPVLGPVPISDQRALTPMVTRLQVAFPVDLPIDAGVDGRLTGLPYPTNLAALPWRTMEFAGRMADLHLQTAALDGQDFVSYFLVRLEVPEQMRLAVCLGYDGPVKLFYDGMEVHHDPEGVNPAWEDKARVAVPGDAGTHEVLVALGSNKNRAWGIFLRFERLDVAPKLVKQGAGAYAMPRVVEE